MRIAIVNDMPMAVEALRRILALDPDYKIAWTAADGAEAVRQCAADLPDLVLMDLVMPRMDGVEATRQIMAHTPCPILIVTSNVEDNAGKVFAAMGHGALDAVDTPLLAARDPSAMARPLLAKIRMLGGLARERRGKGDGASRNSKRGPLVAIGASAGGPAALAALFSKLPVDFPAPIVVVQHVDERFANDMAKWLTQHSPLPVAIAAEASLPKPGVILLAGTSDHLVMRRNGHLGYTATPAEAIYRPSVDVFFNSLAIGWTGPVVGVLLTGMGSDGARGLKALRDAGHYTVAQDRATSAVYGMPKAAAALSAAIDVLPLDRIPAKLMEKASSMPREKVA